MIFTAEDHDHPSTSGWIRTVSGTWIHLLNPDGEMVNSYDIAYGLSKVNRFGGHTEWPYSVAEHSLNVAALLERQFGDEQLTLIGLLHDASEAYLGDVVRPLKQALPEYKLIEERMQAVIAGKFGFDPIRFHDPRVKDADEFMLIAEMAMIRNCEWREPSAPDLVADAMYSRLSAAMSER